MITLDIWGTSGFCARFKYDEQLILQLRQCLGFAWDKKARLWTSEGPDVLLDLERFHIPFLITPPARLRADQFYRDLNRLLDIKSTPASEALYSFQPIGSESLSLQEHGILADDMGLGKSKQALDAAALSGANDILVVCPKTLVWNWEAEVTRWCPDWIPYVIPDKKAERDEAYKIIAKERAAGSAPRVIIANYEKMMTVGWPMAKRWDVLIFDEAQRAKNKKTQTNRLLYQIAQRSLHVYALTGTPLEMRIEELFGIMSVVRPSVFGTITRFRDQHMILSPYDGAVVGIKNADRLKERYGPWMTRRKKSDVLKQLPPKIYTEAYVELSTAERSLYGEIRKGFDTWLKDEGRLAGSANVLTQLIRFQQFTSSPELLGIDTLGHGSKFWELLTLLSDWDGRALVFTRFKQMANRLHTWLGCDPTALITGDISDAKERLTRIDAFNRGELGKVFVATDAAAFGLSVQADLVIHYDKLWNPAKEWQREDRCHGVGRGMEGRVTNVVHMLAKGTLDEGMHQVTLQRAELFHDIVDKAEDAVLARFRPADYQALITGGLKRARED